MARILYSHMQLVGWKDRLTGGVNTHPSPYILSLSSFLCNTNDIVCACEGRALKKESSLDRSVGIPGIRMGWREQRESEGKEKEESHGKEKGEELVIQRTQRKGCKFKIDFNIRREGLKQHEAHVRLASNRTKRTFWISSSDISLPPFPPYKNYKFRINMRKTVNVSHM